MLLSMVCSAASYTDVPETHEKYAAINMLSSMDIITGFPDGTFKPDDAVTRAQMAALITRMFNLSNSAVSAAPFSDVATDYWAVSNIVAAKNMNIINGFPDGTFQPEASVTYEQAVKMIVCALNYGTAAEALGGYPAGYIQQASKLNLLKNAASANTEPSPRGIVAQLLYNRGHIDERPETRENRIVCAYAFAAADQNADCGTIVTAPTCGSCAVLPAVMKYMQEKKGFSDDVMLNGLAVAGDGEIKLFTSTGRATMVHGSGYTNPKICASDTTVLVYDQGRRSFTVFKRLPPPSPQA